MTPFAARLRPAATATTATNINNHITLIPPRPSSKLEVHRHHRGQPRVVPAVETLKLRIAQRREKTCGVSDWLEKLAIPRRHVAQRLLPAEGESEHVEISVMAGRSALRLGAVQRQLRREPLRASRECGPGGIDAGKQVERQVPPVGPAHPSVLQPANSAQ